MSPHSNARRLVSTALLAIALAGCGATNDSAATTTTQTTATDTTGPIVASCDPEVGPAVVSGEVGQSSGGIGGWVWHAIRPTGCQDWYSVVNLSANEVKVSYDPCQPDCIADGIYSSSDYVQMELHGRFVERSAVASEILSGDKDLVFVADGRTHAPDADRQMISDIADTTWTLTSAITRTESGHVLGPDSEGLVVKLSIDLSDIGALYRLTGTTTGEGEFIVESATPI